MASKFDKAQELETIELRDHATLDEADNTNLEKSMDPSQELDEPHVAALHGNTKLEISFRTTMSIVFLGLAVVAPISCAQIMVGAVLEAIATELEMTPAFVNWVLASWALAATEPVIIVGKVSDIFGRCWVMTTGNAIVLIGCAVSGTAKHQEQLVSGSVIIGFCFGFGFNQLAFIAIPELCPFKYRSVTIAGLAHGFDFLACMIH